jgi:hypothetical protein
MNKQSRKTLGEAYTILCELNDAENLLAMSDEAIKTMLDEASNLITNVAEEEREKFDNMSEGLQASPTGQAIEEAADLLEGVNLDLTWTREAEGDDDPEGWAEQLASEVQDVIDEFGELL